MGFGEWAISEELYEDIKSILPEGKTILEFGSGSGTHELLKHWSVISVEDNGLTRLLGLMLAHIAVNIYMPHLLPLRSKINIPTLYGIIMKPYLQDSKKMTLI